MIVAHRSLVVYFQLIKKVNDITGERTTPAKYILNIEEVKKCLKAFNDLDMKIKGISSRGTPYLNFDTPYYNMLSDKDINWIMEAFARDSDILSVGPEGRFYINMLDGRKILLPEDAHDVGDFNKYLSIQFHFELE